MTKFKKILLISLLNSFFTIVGLHIGEILKRCYYNSFNTSRVALSNEFDATEKLNKIQDINNNHGVGVH